MWHGTEEEASIAVPGNLPNALASLGLEKAVGYLWLVPQSVCTLPTPGADQEASPTVYVPYNISLGVPLYNRGLCSMVRYRMLTIHFFQ